MNQMSVVVWGIDDIRPEDHCEKPLKLLEEFKQSYDQVKITLFVTPDWIYKPQGKLLSMDFSGILRKFVKYQHWPEGSFRIDKDKEWINRFQDFELADHGLHHFQDRRPVSAEFANLNYEQCAVRIKKILEIFSNTGVRPEGFAPPGWGVNENLLNALSDSEFKYVAGSIDDGVVVEKNSFSKQAGLTNVSAFFPTNLGKIWNIPRNWDIHKSDIERAEEIIKINGIVGLHAHILDEYLGQKIGNGITEDNLKNVEKLLDYLENSFSEIKYKTFLEVSQDTLSQSMQTQSVPEE